MQSTIFSVDNLRAALTVLREHGASSAEFAENGALVKVEFFAPLPAELDFGKDEPARRTIDNEVEQAQLRLATGAHRRKGNDDGIPSV